MFIIMKISGKTDLDDQMNFLKEEIKTITKFDQLSNSLISCNRKLKKKEIQSLPAETIALIKCLNKLNSAMILIKVMMNIPMMSHITVNI